MHPNTVSLSPSEIATSFSRVTRGRFKINLHHSFSSHAPLKPVVSCADRYLGRPAGHGSESGIKAGGLRHAQRNNHHHRRPRTSCLRCCVDPYENRKGGKGRTWSSPRLPSHSNPATHRRLISWGARYAPSEGAPVGRGDQRLDCAGISPLSAGALHDCLLRIGLSSML